MSENFGIGNKFDAAWKEARQQLISEGNTKPTTQEILHYLVDKWKPQQDTTKIVVQGFHFEHTEAPVMKYGANIGCVQDDSVPQINVKYGANIGCKPPVTVQPDSLEVVAPTDNPPSTQQVHMKYGANTGCKPPVTVQPDSLEVVAPTDNPPSTQQVHMKYGANVGCVADESQDTPQILQLKYGVHLTPQPVIISDSTINVKYGANIGCSPIDENEQTISVKYGANIGCGKKKFKVSSNPAVQKILDAYRNNRLNNVKSITVDREAGTITVKREKTE